MRATVGGLGLTSVNYSRTKIILYKTFDKTSKFEAHILISWFHSQISTILTYRTWKENGENGQKEIHYHQNQIRKRNTNNGRDKHY